MQWADFHAGFSEGDGMAGDEMPSCPKQVSGDFILLNNLCSITLSLGLSKPEGTSWAAKACLGLAQACLGGHRFSSVVLEGLRSCWYFCGVVGLQRSVLMHNLV